MIEERDNVTPSHSLRVCVSEQSKREQVVHCTENTFGNCVKTKFNHHFDQLSAHLIVQLQQIEKINSKIQLKRMRRQKYFYFTLGMRPLAVDAVGKKKIPRDVSVAHV